MTSPICSTRCGDSPGSSGGGVYSAAKANSAVFFVPAGAPSQVPLQVLEFDVGPAVTVDLAGDRVVVEQGGFYEIIVGEAWSADPDPVQFRLSLVFDGVIQQRSQLSEPLISKDGTISGLFELEAGTVITLQASFFGTTTEVVLVASISVEKRN